MNKILKVSYKKKIKNALNSQGLKVGTSALPILREPTLRGSPQPQNQLKEDGRV